MTFALLLDPPRFFRLPAIFLATSVARLLRRLLFRPIGRGWLPVGLLVGLLGLGLAPAAAQDRLLEPERAFRFSARALDERSVEVRFRIADGYYMYREHFAFAAAPAATRLGVAELPPGQVKFDGTFQKDVETYRKEILIRLPVQSADGAFKLAVTSQGCADVGVCYPPMQSQAEVRLAAFGGGDAPGRVRVLSAQAAQSWNAAAAGGNWSDLAYDLGRLEAVLGSGSLLATMGVFLAAGLLLSLTPCVLPMVPILSSIIVGHGHRVSRASGFGLALAYALGMALVYTLFGIAAGLLGQGLAAALQNPWVLGAFALLLVVLALSMFGMYELQPPAALQSRLTQLSERLPGGKVLAVFLMGGLSALIVGPCVAAPLAGALLYISQTRDVLLGGGALFALAIGMSVPLLLVGLSAGTLLPRAGQWMVHVKHLFGVLLLAVALWMIAPVIAGWVAMGLWGALLLIGAVYLHVFDKLPPGARGLGKFAKGVGVVLAVLGAAELIGAVSGGSDPLQPLKHLAARGGAAPVVADTPRFVRVTTLAQLEQAVQSAGRPVMLEFYADWCVTCKEMETTTFNDPQVREKLSRLLLVQVDVTANSEHDQALLQRFQLFGPPGILFFDAQGRELGDVRVIGFQPAERFLQSLRAAGV